MTERSVCHISGLLCRTPGLKVSELVNTRRTTESPMGQSLRVHQTAVYASKANMYASKTNNTC